MPTALSDCVNCGRSNPEIFRVCPDCSFPLMLVAGKYRLLRVLAGGGMGKVYLAEHIHLDYDTERVVKVIKPEALEHPSMAKRFRREVQVTAALSQRNEHIVRIYDDFGEEKGLGHYYVMEYLQGVTLHQLLSRQERLSLAIALSIFSQFCNAMAAAHRKGIVHRDLKPENIVLIQRGAEPHFVKVIDFGIARPGEDAEVSRLTHGIIGTPLYMAPEQCTNAAVTTRTDIYSMGLILYEMLTGTNPYGLKPNSQMMDMLSSHLMRAPTLLSSRFPALAFLDPILETALAKSAPNRFATVENLWNAIVENAPSDLQLRSMVEADEPAFPFALSIEEAPTADSLPAHSDPDRPSGRLVSGQAIPHQLPLAERGTGVVASSTKQRHIRQIAAEKETRVSTPSPNSGFTERLLASELEQRQTGERQVDGLSTTMVPNEIRALIEATTAAHAKKNNYIPWLIGVGVLLILALGGMMYMEYLEHSEKKEHKAQTPVVGTPSNVAQPKEKAPTTLSTKLSTNLSAKPSQPVKAVAPATIRKHPAPPQRPHKVANAPVHSSGDSDDNDDNDDNDDKPQVQKASPRERVHRKRRRKIRRRRIHQRVASRVVHREQSGPCGTAPEGSHWVVGQLRYPIGLRARLRFRNCQKCRVQRKNSGYCLQIPNALKRVKLSISVSGFQTCTHWLEASQRSLQWKLKREDPDSLTDSFYRCVR